jgi:hypothetical protein
LVAGFKLPADIRAAAACNIGYSQKGVGYALKYLLLVASFGYGYGKTIGLPET